jgi:hypothetical protein
MFDPSSDFQNQNLGLISTPPTIVRVSAIYKIQLQVL